MKRFWVGIGLVLLVVVPAGASEIAIGAAFMDADEADNDVGITTKFILDVGDRWNIDVRASFFDGHGFVHPQRTLGIEATPIDVGISYDFHPTGKPSAYVGAGLNYTLFKSTAINTGSGMGEQSRVKDEPGWYALVGFKGPLTGRIGYFVEGIYRQNKANVQGDGLAAFDNIGVNFAGGTAAAGLSYNW